MALKNDSWRKNQSLENWRAYGGSLDRFDRNNWRERGLYEDLSKATKCGTSQVSVLSLILEILENSIVAETDLDQSLLKELNALYFVL